MFTLRTVDAPGVNRITDDDYSAVIACARECEPLPENVIRTSVVGHHGRVLLDAAPTIVDAVKAGKISHCFLLGGCDGAEPGRNYYSDYAQNAPEDAFVLTLGCGKYRIRNHDYGTHLGLPRLMDMGQCNDAYGAIQVAVALANAFECSVNDLPLTIVLSWFEQKAVAVLLTLLALDVKNITVGPNPPAFVTPNVFQVLQDKWGLKLMGESGKEDVKAVFATA
jgi:hydroxylamine reductase